MTTPTITPDFNIRCVACAACIPCGLASFIGSITAIDIG